VARRDITNCAFSTKEIKEITKLKNIDFYMLKREVEKSLS